MQKQLGESLPDGHGFQIEVVFPKARDLPPITSQPVAIAPVAPDVLSYLARPEWGQLATPILKAPPVPKVAVYEDHDAVAAMNEVRPTRQVSRLGVDLCAELGNHRRYLPLRSGVPTPDPGHRCRSLLHGHDVPTHNSFRLNGLRRGTRRGLVWLLRPGFTL